MPLERGFDISGNQAANHPTVLARWADPTYTFVLIKATEGERFDDSVYLLHRLNAFAAGKKVGAYHFGWCNQDPIVEAQHFVRTADLKPGMVGCLDAEDWGPRDPVTKVRTAMVGITWAMRVDWILRWLREFRRLTGYPALLYMNWNWVKGCRTAASTAQWAELVTYLLWLADIDSGVPGVHPSVNPKAAGGPTFTVAMHQWTVNEGGLDGDAMENPALWGTIAVEDDMTDAQYAALKAQNDAVLAAVAKLTNMVEQKANIVDVRANTQAIAALKDQADALALKVSDTNGAIGLAAADVNARIDGMGDAVAEQVTSAVVGALDDSLGGIEVSARYVRQKE